LERLIQAPQRRGLVSYLFYRFLLVRSEARAPEAPFEFLPFRSGMGLSCSVVLSIRFFEVNERIQVVAFFFHPPFFLRVVPNPPFVARCSSVGHCLSASRVRWRYEVLNVATLAPFLSFS